jgi:hypothetical protein
MGRDVLRAVGRFTDHLEPSETTVGTAGWAGAIFGGLGLASAAGLYYASRRAAEPGQQGTGYSAIPGASQSATEKGASPGAEPETYFAILDAPRAAVPVIDPSDAQKTAIAKLVRDPMLNSLGPLTRASDGTRAVSGVFRWRGDKGAWVVSRTVLSNPKEIVVHTSGPGHAALQVIDVGKAKGELPEITSPREFPVSPHFAAGLHAILADSTAEHAVAYWADKQGAKSARISRAYRNPTSFLYRGPEKQDDIIIRTTASTLTGGSAGTIVEPRLGSDKGWFETMFGFSDHAEDHRSEESKAKFLEHKKNFTYDAGTGTMTSVNGGVWDAGTFTTPSLAELREQTKSILRSHGKARNTTLSVVVGDVAVLHGDPRYAGAVFQAASQFNCLEFTREDYTPE